MHASQYATASFSFYLQPLLVDMSVLVVFITLPLILSALLLPVSHCQPSDTSYRLVWSEEFNYANGAQPSSAIWNWETGAGGWGNNELEFYTERPVNSYINNSALVIQANAESYYGSPYTSARINTAGKVEVYQGYVAARARISMANGFWPAVWMLGSAAQGWPWCGEVGLHGTSERPISLAQRRRPHSVRHTTLRQRRHQRPELDLHSHSPGSIHHYR